ncbi:MAG: ATP-binding protein [Clostridia bacterium]|nr:ATP-binding protein [Clostridia bacterium]
MKVILLIGKIASGKTTYARKLGGMLISCDQLMQSMFPGGCGEHHDMLAERARKYLLGLARQCAASGVTPVVDFGFWTPALRQEAIDALPVCELEWHYLDIPEDEWRRRIEKRNAAILAGQGSPSDYFVDEGLLQKVNSLFVPPTAEELPGLIVVRE